MAAPSARRTTAGAGWRRTRPRHSRSARRPCRPPGRSPMPSTSPAFACGSPLGRRYAIHCRVPATPGDHTPPSTDEGKPLAGEEVLLDGNALAEGHDFFQLGTFDVSPDGQWLAYSVDFAGDERFDVHIKNLATG